MARKGRRATGAAKARTGIDGFDEVTGGGLPRGRICVVLGGPGCGKTIFALQSLVTAAAEGEASIFVSFEQDPAHVVGDARTFTWNIDGLVGSTIRLIDAQLSQAIARDGDFDLIGLLAIVAAEAKRLRATRVVFDGLDVLLSHLASSELVRREMFRLREWLYETKLTGVITAKADARGVASIELDFLQFLADCLIVLQHRVNSAAAMRLMRIAKYRGQAHATNEFPFTITERGIEVGSAGTSVLDHPASSERVTSGVERLDAMLGGGYYRGSSVLISGAPGTSKTSLSAAFAAAACRRRERTVYVSFDEAPAQVIRNIASIGVDLQRPRDAGLLAMCSIRARADNPETHVAQIRSLIERHGARNLIIDPISALAYKVDSTLVDRAAVQVLDIAKARGITTVSTSLLGNAAPMSEETPIGISTIADTWMHVSYVNKGGERNRALTIVKSRGMKHSNQVRELILSDAGITLADPYTVGGEVLMGTLRWEREMFDRRAKEQALTETDLHQKQAELALAEIRVRIEAAQTEQALREAELRRILATRLAGHEAERLESLERSQRRGDDLPVKRAKPPRTRR